MASPAAVTRRTVFTFTTFDAPDAHALHQWLATRSQFLSSLPNRDRPPLFLNRIFDDGELGATWTLIASNGRPVATSTEIFAGIDTARDDALATKASVDELELLHTNGGTLSAPHGWLMRLDGFPQIMPVRWYPTPRLRNKNAASAITSLRTAVVLGLSDNEPAATSGYGAGAAALRGRPDSRPSAVARTSPGVAQELNEEPIKTRGEPRPIRPIMRSHELRTPRRGLRMKREGEV
jgi:hypothetical protein